MPKKYYVLSLKKDRDELKKFVVKKFDLEQFVGFWFKFKDMNNISVENFKEIISQAQKENYSFNGGLNIAGFKNSRFNSFLRINTNIILFSTLSEKNRFLKYNYEIRNEQKFGFSILFDAKEYKNNIVTFFTITNLIKTEFLTKGANYTYGGSNEWKFNILKRYNREKLLTPEFNYLNQKGKHWEDDELIESHYKNYTPLELYYINKKLRRQEEKSRRIKFGECGHCFHNKQNFSQNWDLFWMNFHFEDHVNDHISSDRFYFILQPYLYPNKNPENYNTIISNFQEYIKNKGINLFYCKGIHGDNSASAFIFYINDLMQFLYFMNEELNSHKANSEGYIEFNHNYINKTKVRMSLKFYSEKWNDNNNNALDSAIQFLNLDAYHLSHENTSSEHSQINKNFSLKNEPIDAIKCYCGKYNCEEYIIHKRAIEDFNKRIME